MNKKYERRKWNKPRKRKQLKRQQIETTKIRERKINGKKRKKINIEYCVIISRGGVLVLRANCVKKTTTHTHRHIQCVLTFLVAIAGAGVGVSAIRSPFVFISRFNLKCGGAVWVNGFSGSSSFVCHKQPDACLSLSFCCACLLLRAFFSFRVCKPY